MGSCDLKVYTVRENAMFVYLSVFARIIESNKTIQTPGQKANSYPEDNLKAI